tara:strand:+ start:162 stop:392 length:231 start_codon:yes stop_codon:yes gene_type:complete
MSRPEPRPVTKRGTLIEVRNNDVMRAYKKLKRILQDEDVFNEMRDRTAFITEAVKRKKFKAAGRKRWLKKRSEANK